jgi:hypothetical protein
MPEDNAISIIRKIVQYQETNIPRPESRNQNPGPRIRSQNHCVQKKLSEDGFGIKVARHSSGFRAEQAIHFTFESVAARRESQYAQTRPVVCVRIWLFK